MLESKKDKNQGEILESKNSVDSAEPMTCFRCKGLVSHDTVFCPTCGVRLK